MPNCPSCDNVEMIATDRGNTRECPICGYAEPHEAPSSNTRSNRAARRAQQRSQKSPRPRQQRRALRQEQQQALFDSIEQARTDNPGSIVVIDESLIHTADHWDAVAGLFQGARSQ